MDSQLFSIQKNAFAATLLISLLPNLLLFVIPSSLLSSERKSRINYQNLLLMFSSGGLLGDVFLHILPHLLGTEDSHKNEADDGIQEKKCFSGISHNISINLIILFGFVLFFIMEKFFKLNVKDDDDIKQNPNSVWIDSPGKTMQDEIYQVSTKTLKSAQSFVFTKAVLRSMATAGLSHELVKRINKKLEVILERIAPQSPNWEVIESKNGFTSRKRAGPMVCVIGEVVVPYSVKDCFELIIDSRRVTEVDSDVKKAKIIKHLTATTRVQQLKMKPIWPTSPRDLVCLQHWRMLDDGRVVMLGFDEVCEECPPSADYVRVNMEIEGFVLTRTDQGTLVQRIAQFDIMGSVPLFVKNYAVTAHPKVVLDLKKVLDSDIKKGKKPQSADFKFEAQCDWQGGLGDIELLPVKAEIEISKLEENVERAAKAFATEIASTKIVQEVTRKAKEALIEEKKSIGHFFYAISRINASGWLNLLADSLHNFTDGIALGASFMAASHLHHHDDASITTEGNMFASLFKPYFAGGLAFATVLSVLLHEIPHEIGDFAILIKAGLSKWEAIKVQFFTAIAAFLGTFFGLMIGKNECSENILMAITAGGFMYIATVNTLPTVTQEKSGLLQIILEVMCFVSGVGFMVLVAILESLGEGGHH